MNRYPENLSPQFINSYAFFIVKERLPVTVTKIIDELYKDWEKIGNMFGDVAKEELKSVVSNLVKLKNEIQSNDPLIPLTLYSTDYDEWNKSLYDLTRKMTVPPSWYTAPLLYVQCYLYRRIFEAFQRGRGLRSYDYFTKQKENALTSSIDSAIVLGQYLKCVVKDIDSEQKIRDHLTDLLRISLWTDRCDLAPLGVNDSENENENADKPKPKPNLTAILNSFQPYIVANNIDSMLDYLLATKRSKPQGLVIDIVLESSGFELICDFCLAHFLTVSKLAKQIRFYVKRMPWFITDVTPTDFLSVLRALTNLCQPNEIVLNELASVWNQNVRDMTWTIETGIFWTCPYPYSEMRRCAPNLYSKLAQADLIILKGDLNYRKLTGDCMWNFTTPLDTALRGFNPSPLCVLRTLRAETVVGLVPGQARDIGRVKKDWMIVGKFGVIQFTKKVA